MDSENPYDSLEFRVTLSTNPKSQINHASELFPDAKTLEDHENLNVTTEKIRVKPYRISESKCLTRCLINFNLKSIEYLGF